MPWKLSPLRCFCFLLNLQASVTSSLYGACPRLCKGECRLRKLRGMLEGTQTVEQFANDYKAYNVTQRVLHLNASSGVTATCELGSSSPAHSYPHASRGRAQHHLRYNYSIPLPQRLAGVSYVGHAARLRLLVHRIRQGEPVVVGALGGSITAGQGVGGARRTYVAYLERWLNAAMPPVGVSEAACAAGASPVEVQRRSRQLQVGTGNATLPGAVPTAAPDSPRTSFTAGQARRHIVHNGAVPGTQSSYVTACVEQHLPPRPDLVLLDFAVNDPPAPSRDYMDTQRRALERLLRKLLRMPSRPAVVLVNFLAYNAIAPDGHGCCNFWYNAERDFLELGLYYGLPSVSLKAAVFPAVVSNTSAALSAGAIFNAGRYHPGSGGHVIAFELLVTLLQEVIASDARLIRSIARQSHGNDTEAAAADVWAMFQAEAAQPLPPPLSRGNYEPGRSTCLIQSALRDVVQQPAEGWEWTDEGRGKWGYVTMGAGRQLRIKVSTLLPGQEPGGSVILQVVYLRSYKGMGQARVSCEHGCTCSHAHIDAHDGERQVSVAATADMQVTQAAECVLLVTTLGPTPNRTNGYGTSDSPGNKFKVMGLLLGEDTEGKQGMVDNFIRPESLELARSNNKQ